jgi:hypothetical protein
VLDFVDDGMLEHDAFNIVRFAADANWPASFGRWLNEYGGGEDFRLAS